MKSISFCLSLLPLLLLLAIHENIVLASPSISIRRFGGPTILLASTESSTETANDPKEEEEEEAPLQSVPVPLPNIVEEKDSHKPIVWKRKKPSFDIIHLTPEALPFHKRQKAPRKEPHKRKRLSGTRFDLRAPSPERITQWFAPTEDGFRRRSKSIFNHDSVGMTNPVLSIGNSNAVDYEATSSVSLSHQNPDSLEFMELGESWIPATTTTPPQPPQNGQAARALQYSHQVKKRPAEKAWFPATHPISKRKWRECRYRRRVGQGQACYERVRDAALEWQFHHDQSAEGILPVSADDDDDKKKKKKNCFSLDDSTTSLVQPIWSGPHSSASRRLVTFTTCGFHQRKFKWLPKLYTLNPCMVVYDLLDQRGPATTYTSTAYATLKGHFLSGEERVTVALRDDTGFVDVEILSYSKPGQSLKAKLVWPMIGKLQQRFFQHQLDYLERVAFLKPNNNGVSPSTTPTTKP